MSRLRYLLIKPLRLDFFYISPLKFRDKIQWVWQEITFFVATKFYSKSYNSNFVDIETPRTLFWNHCLASHMMAVHLLWFPYGGQNLADRQTDQQSLRRTNIFIWRLLHCRTYSLGETIQFANFLFVYYEWLPPCHLFYNYNIYPRASNLYKMNIQNLQFYLLSTSVMILRT